MLETVHSLDTATFGGLGGIPLNVFSTATSFKESLFFLLRFEPFKITSMSYNLIFNCSMLETVHFVDTATFGGLGGIPLCVFSTATFFKES